MANYFVDSTTGSDSDDGSTMDLAWATTEHALTLGGLSAGDTVWVRRLHNELPTVLVDFAYAGTAENPIRIVGWPRNSDASITSATWTNGSTIVDLIVGLSMTRESHLGRYITAPDGETYMITYITDTNTVIIDREYVGATVSGANGACTIQADEDYNLAQAIDDSGWTITKASYNADSDDLPQIDFNDGSVATWYIYTDSHNYVIRNIDFVDPGYVNGGVYARSVNVLEIMGCIFRGTPAGSGGDSCMSSNDTDIFITRCVFDANGSQNGIAGQGGTIVMKDCAQYGANSAGLYTNDDHIWVYLENVNIGVEVANGVYDLRIQNSNNISGRDVKLGGGGTYDVFVQGVPQWHTSVAFENYNKILGAHKEWTSQGTVTKVDVVEGSGDPYKRTSGSDSLIEILYDQSNLSNNLKSPIRQFTPYLFTHEFEVDDTPKSYRYYVQAEGAVAADELWIEVEYVSSYDDTSEYTITKAISTNSISARSGAGDWSQFLEVNNITPAVASKVRIKCYCRYYHATNKIYIDPQVRVS